MHRKLSDPLEINNLNAGYNKSHVLFDVLLNIKEGEFCTILKILRFN